MTHSVVLRLLEGLEGRGHHVYMDNFYSLPSGYAKGMDMQEQQGRYFENRRCEEKCVGQKFP